MQMFLQIGEFAQIQWMLLEDAVDPLTRVAVMGKLDDDLQTNRLGSKAGIRPSWRKHAAPE